MSRQKQHPAPWIEPRRALPAGAAPDRGETLGPPATAASRRTFLKGLGIGAAASLSACQRSPVRHALPYLVPPEDVTPGVPVHYASTCLACPAACGLMVTVLDGRPVKLEGHASHPLSKGGLCAIGQADVRALYDAGRLREPTLEGKPVTFAALDTRVAERLGAIRKAGRKLYVLSPTLASPTARETVAAFLAPHGGTLVEHDAGAAPASAALEAYELLTGRALIPAPDFFAADLVVSLGADFLATGPEPVAATSAWAARRRESGTRGAPRLFQVEGSLSLTGAAADERWSATAAERRRLALWIASRVAEATDATAVASALRAVPPPPAPARAAALAAELLAHRGRGLLLSASDDLGEQLAVALANRLLGNEERTLDVLRPSLVRRGVDRDLAALLADVDSGAAGAVVILDLDPVDQLPGGEGSPGARRPPAVGGDHRPADSHRGRLRRPALEVELVAQVGLGAGRSAHVPWLRELPDPLTRVSWTGCVRLAPSRAEALGVADGDHVRVEVAGRSVTLPRGSSPARTRGSWACRSASGARTATAASGGTPATASPGSRGGCRTRGSPPRREGPVGAKRCRSCSLTGRRRGDRSSTSSPGSTRRSRATSTTRPRASGPAGRPPSRSGRW
ncbi:MAG: hypothetical protein IPL89_14675 [Acidobacteria bacterium]|nr:hypothetical protein [Acidobacteriota bacterium]